VAPAVLEDRLREHPLIAECVVTGDRRPYIGVLITLDIGESAIECATRAGNRDLRAVRRDFPGYRLG
jgi:long-subunit acyl-CoA synthetase (AMP-forming)